MILYEVWGLLYEIAPIDDLLVEKGLRVLLLARDTISPKLSVELLLVTAHAAVE